MSLLLKNWGHVHGYEERFENSKAVFIIFRRQKTGGDIMLDGGGNIILIWLKLLTEPSLELTQTNTP